MFFKSVTGEEKPRPSDKGDEVAGASVMLNAGEREEVAAAVEKENADADGEVEIGEVGEEGETGEAGAAGEDGGEVTTGTTSAAAISSSLDCLVRLSTESISSISSVGDLYL